MGVLYILTGGVGYLFFFLWYSLIMYLRLDLNFCCSAGWPQVLGSSPLPPMYWHYECEPPGPVSYRDIFWHHGACGSTLNDPFPSEFLNPIGRELVLFE